MKLKNLTLTELKALSYTDIAYMVLSENKKKLNTPSLFRKVCDLLGYTDEEYTAKIGDFYTSLTTDCRFIILSNAEWDLRDKHVVKVEVDDEDEAKEEEENIDEVTDDGLDDDEDDDMDDLSIVDEDEEEN